MSGLVSTQEGGSRNGVLATMETTIARVRGEREREQIKRDLQRAHDLVLLTLDVLMHSMKYDPYESIDIVSERLSYPVALDRT